MEGLPVSYTHLDVYKRQIFTLADQQRQGTAPADLKQKIDQIARNTTTLR